MQSLPRAGEQHYLHGETGKVGFVPWSNVLWNTSLVVIIPHPVEVWRKLVLPRIVSFVDATQQPLSISDGVTLSVRDNESTRVALVNSENRFAIYELQVRTH